MDCMIPSGIEWLDFAVSTFKDDAASSDSISEDMECKKSNKMKWNVVV